VTADNIIVLTQTTPSEEDFRLSIMAQTYEFAQFLFDEPATENVKKLALKSLLSQIVS
jgi:hypothetical protein